ncbi:hypothetical protein [Photobacterium damselae]|uniref:hypothetical protein n=1 Tax=Photobacterium damselae TaxID=38293 RepID=UPI000D04E565|nr:hypothetical protein [Photobacterium damselae]AWK82240.1 hypothetical protein BST98_09400 [Photobacterium damselae]PSB78309.1 hypothetical protein C5F61_08255 [Photobacterium damselae subsp. damselae]
MKVKLPLQIYHMSVISQARVAYKEYALVTVERNKQELLLTIFAREQFNDIEKREILGSFLNYILQLSAIEALNLEVE